MRALLVIAIALVARAGFAADDPLTTAKELYASAAYEEALSALGGISGAAGGDVARQADQYRAFCLFALGRTREAESVAESLIRQKPLLHLDAADASPRLEKMFADVRQRLLPGLIRERFRTARAALDQKSSSAAEPALVETSQLLAEAGKIGIKDDGLSDLSVLVDGFLQLIRTTAEQQALQTSIAASRGTAAPVFAPAPIAPPPTPSIIPAAAADAAPRPAAVTALAAEQGDARVYSIDDKDVVPPAPIEQAVPGMPPDIMQIVKSSRSSGIIDLVIDETGKVVDATLRQSLHPVFDPLLMRSVRRWRYTPATKEGTAVRFLKTVAVVP